jgi:hypothetical protein
VTREGLAKAIKGLNTACFRCGKEAHSEDCPIGKAIDEIRALQEKMEQGGYDANL